MKFKTILIISALAIILIGAAAFYWGGSRGPDTAAPTAGSLASVPEDYEVPELVQSYTNDEHGFSLKLPRGFTANAFESGQSTVIILDGGKGLGIQILVSPYGEDVKVFTADMIHRDLPDLTLADIQTVEIGEDRTGVAFRSDNEDFGGASREVWFVFEGDLYQISTYESLDRLLRAIFGTWQFWT